MNDCQLGDAYQDERREPVLNDPEMERWSCEEKKYLSYVKHLVPRWPQLELLADFMEVGTIPTRWCIFPGEQKQNGQRQRYTYPIDIEPRRSEQRYRASRVNAALLRYQAKEKCVITRFKSQKPGDEASAALGRAADHIAKTASRDEFNLFVVEDLSRDVIESLGGAFGIDPRFFRAHITEYVWNNIRDRWREPSVLEVDAQRRDWFQMRLVRSRYFSTQKELGDAKKEADGFNIVRRVIADDNDIFWDKDLECARSWWHKSEGRLETEPVDAKIGHIRSRATFWLSPDLPVGVLLLEPTPKTGFPLWRGYGNWDNIPQFEHRLYERPEYPYDNHEIPPSLQRKETDNHMSWFEEYLYWAQRPIHPVKLPESQGNTVHSVPIQSLLHLVCGEWLTFADYLNTRLNQIDWGIANPSFFPDTDTDSRKQSLDKLHFWRRSVPQARDMLQNCIRQTFQFTGSLDVPRITKPYEDDYKAVMERLIDYELRIDRLSSAVNSAISLEDARSTSNLTILASIFIPPSLVAALLSMSTDPLAELFPALKWWAIVSTTVVVIIFGVLLALNSADKWLEKVKLLILIPMSYIQAEAKNKDWETNSIV